MRDKAYHYSRQAPCGSAQGAWPRLDGAPRPTLQSAKSYDANRKKMSKFLGLDFIFTQREYLQSVKIDKNDREVIVSSSRNGKILAVRPVPTRLEKVLKVDSYSIKSPRNEIGLPYAQQRVERLSYLVHVLTQKGIPDKDTYRDLLRISKIWCFIRYTDLCKLIRRIVSRVIRKKGHFTRSPRRSYDCSYYPAFRGEKYDESHKISVQTYVWTKSGCEATR
jgi:hypothetical protein